MYNFSPFEILYMVMILDLFYQDVSGSLFNKSQNSCQQYKEANSGKKVKFI